MTSCLFLESSVEETLTFRGEHLVAVDTQERRGAGLSVDSPDLQERSYRYSNHPGDIAPAPSPDLPRPPDGDGLDRFVARWQALVEQVVTGLGAEPHLHRLDLTVRRLRQNVVMAADGHPVRTEERHRLRVTCTARAADGVLRAHSTRAVFSAVGEPCVDDVRSASLEAARAAAWHLSPRALPTRPVPLVLASMAAGVLLHESIGHGLEADNVLDRDGTLGSVRRQRVAVPDLTIIDDPAYPGMWSTSRYDDEGVCTQPTVLVDRGVLSGLLHTRSTASRLAGTARGNGRRCDYRHPALARMTTTYARPSSVSTADLFRGLERAVVCRVLDGGQVDTATGRLTFTLREAELVERGEPVSPVAPFPYACTAMEALSRIRAVGDDLSLSPGICVKRGQALRVTVGAPTLVLEEVAAA